MPRMMVSPVSGRCDAEGRILLGEAARALVMWFSLVLSSGSIVSEMTGSGTNIEVISSLSYRR